MTKIKSDSDRVRATGASGENGTLITQGGGTQSNPDAVVVDVFTMKTRFGSYKGMVPAFGSMGRLETRRGGQQLLTRFDHREATL